MENDHSPATNPVNSAPIVEGKSILNPCATSECPCPSPEKCMKGPLDHEWTIDCELISEGWNLEL